MDAHVLVDSEVLGRLLKFGGSDCVSAGKTKEMNVVLTGETADGRSEEHGFVVRVGKNKEDVVLFRNFHLFLVDENEDEGKHVES
jgi:hypothetical protein